MNLAVFQHANDRTSDVNSPGATSITNRFGAAPAWLLTFAVATLLSLIALFVVALLPTGPTLTTLANLLDNPGLVFVFAAALFARSHTSGDKRTMWGLLAVGMFFWIIGEAIYDVRTQIYGDGDQESIADLFFLLFYPAALAGLWLGDRTTRRPGFDVQTLDALIITAVMAMLTWKIIFQPNIELDTSTLGDIVRISYPAFDLVLIWILISQAYQSEVSWDLSRWLLAGGFGGFLAADLFWTVYSSELSGVSVSVALLAVGTAAVVAPSAAETHRTYSRHRARMMHAAVLVVSFVVIGSLTISEAYDHAATLIIAANVIIALVVFRLFLTIEQNEELLADSEKRAGTDPLTGLRNHQYFHDRLKEEVVRANRDQSPVALLMIDIDNFKSVNDIAGHRTGDRVLIDIAQAMRDSSRGTDVVCRIGGDELAVVAPDTDAGTALELAQRLRRRVGQIEVPELIGATHPSISIGCCVYPDLARNATELIERADGTLYTVKQSGRNAAAVFDPGTRGPLSPEEQLSRTQALLAATESDFRAVFTHAHDAMTISDENAVILTVNDAAVRMIGATREQMVGRAIFEFVKPERAGELERVVANTIESGRSTGELKLTAPDGQHLIVEYSTARFSPQRYLSIIRDVTESRRAETAIAESEARFHAVFENALDAMFISDDEGIIRDANHAAALLAQRSLPELIGAHAEQLVPAESVEFVTTERHDLSAEQTRRASFNIRDKHGVSHTFEYTAVADFVPGLHLSIVREVTDRMNATKSQAL